MVQKLVFFGASAFGEIAEIARDVTRAGHEYEIVGILDDNSALHGSYVEGTPVLGPLEQARDLTDVQFVFGIGSARLRLVRHEILGRLNLPNERFATLIHPTAKVYPTVKVGHGTIIFPGAVIFGDTTVEDFVQILANTVVGVKNRICEGALLTSLVSTTSRVTVGHYAHIGTCSAIAENVMVGPGAQVGMASLVGRDVPPGAFVVGQPMRFLDKVDVPQVILDRWAAIKLA